MHIVHTHTTGGADSSQRGEKKKKAKHDYRCGEVITLEELERLRRAVKAEPFDPGKLPALAYVQWKDGEALAEAFARCTVQWPESELYTHFHAPTDQRRKWKFAGTRFLAHPELGTLAVDLIHDPGSPSGLSIGGIEYLDRVMGRHISVHEMERMLMKAAALHAGKFGAR